MYQPIFCSFFQKKMNRPIHRYASAIFGYESADADSSAFAESVIHYNPEIWEHSSLFFIDNFQWKLE